MQALPHHCGTSKNRKCKETHHRRFSPHQYQTDCRRLFEDIFLPAAGYRNNGNLNNEGSNGYYWSSSLNENNSNNGRNLNFNSGNFNPWNNNNRYNGQSVRPVCPSAALIIVKTVYHYKTRA